MGKIKSALQALKKWIFLEDEEEEFSSEQPRYELKLQFDVPAEKAEAAIRVMMEDLREVLDYAFEGVDIQFFGAEVDEIIYDEEDDTKVIDFPQSTEITKKARQSECV